ncbi:MAG: class I SAM-dependent methyltransferase [Catenulispora sp.]
MTDVDAGAAGAETKGPDAAGPRTGAAGRIPLRRLSREHVDTLAALFDPATFHYLGELGVGAGWHCWEVGAGSGSVPRWLAARAGASGRVLATDIDIENLAGDADGFQVERHDLSADPPPAGGFDLVHARLVLDHIRGPERERALGTMAAALRPGGRILVECADQVLQPLTCPDETGPEQELANKVRQAIWSLNAPRGRTPFGRTLPRALRAAGFEDVRAEVRFPLAGPDPARLQRLMVEWARGPATAAGVLTDEEIDRHLADLVAGRLDVAVFPVVSASGVKAAAGGG